MAGPWEKYGGGEDAGPWAKYSPAPSDESPTSFNNLLGAAVEPNLALASGAIAAPVSGLAGIAGSLLPGKAGQGAEWTRKTGEALTWQPRTAGGKTAMEAISYPFRKLAEGAEAVGGKVTDVTGSPLAGTAVDTAIQAVPQLLGAKGLGMAAESAPRMVPKILPNANPAAARLIEQGVQPTPGQLLGGGWDRFEQAISKWPLVGAPIRGARVRAFDQWNKAAVNDALDPVGLKVPEQIDGGHPSVAWARKNLGERYDDLLDKSVGKLGEPSSGKAVSVPSQPLPPASLRQELDTIRSMMNQSKLPKDLKGEFNRIIDDEVINRFESSGLASGRTIQDINSRLYSLEKAKGRSDNNDVRTIGSAIRETRAALKRMTERENPDLAPELKKTDAAWGKFKIVQKASASAGKDGLFSPNQFERAVKAKDPTKDKRAFSEGTANMQDLAKAGREVLGDVIPDSGTPFQLLTAALAESAFGKRGLGLLGVPGGVAASAALAIPYSRPGVAVMRSLIEKPSLGVPGAQSVPIGAANRPDHLTKRILELLTATGGGQQQ